MTLLLSYCCQTAASTSIGCVVLASHRVQSIVMLITQFRSNTWRDPNHPLSEKPYQQNWLRWRGSKLNARQEWCQCIFSSTLLVSKHQSHHSCFICTCAIILILTHWVGDVAFGFGWDWRTSIISILWWWWWWEWYMNMRKRGWPLLFLFLFI